MLHNMQGASKSTKNRSDVNSIKFPSLVSPKVASKFSPHEKVIYEAYIEVLKTKHRVTEKSKLYCRLSVLLYEPMQA